MAGNGSRKPVFHYDLLHPDKNKTNSQSTPFNFKHFLPLLRQKRYSEQEFRLLDVEEMLTELCKSIWSTLKAVPTSSSSQWKYPGQCNQVLPGSQDLYRYIDVLSSNPASVAV
ncbi:hypothetical protein KIN20_017113 [Parelaphostrongylus tenuis]|uniref:Uncharacterized protein n=1 Tax=Parelaphostrongylus tenuis TaxID=148309 RepID=A0AAD5N278_PARTN|nr:hypothetical protein KIN20_017113 [Parelaphostrongylus tenuis]